MKGFALYCHHTSRFQYNTGIQRCVRAIARALIDAGEPVAPLVYDPSSQALRLAGAEACNHLAQWSGPLAHSWASELPPPGSWLLVPELLSGPHQPRVAFVREWCEQREWRLATVFHDAIPLRWGGAATEHHATYMSGLAECNLVLATSRAVADDLRRFWQSKAITPRGHLVVLPLAAEIPGVSRCWPAQGPPPQGALKPLKLLQVGSLEPRKNHKGLLRALAWLESQMPGALELELVGWANNPKVAAMVQRAIALGLPVHWHQCADDAALQQLYAGADLSVYPSLLEGFGLPVLESLWLGTPCLCTSVPSLEAAQVSKGCELLAGSDWKELVRCLKRLILQPSLLSERREELRRMPLQSWAEYVDRMHSILAMTES
ncbi:hypothetical protein CWE16_02085 [Synechococcus sp. BS55D]|nr:hypothetical protein CWE16_02085 [Synechococcus sp. BS55D]